MSVNTNCCLCLFVGLLLRSEARSLRGVQERGHGVQSLQLLPHRVALRAVPLELQQQGVQRVECLGETQVEARPHEGRALREREERGDEEGEGRAEGGCKRREARGGGNEEGGREGGRMEEA